jgi:hypothetical protein
VLLRRLWVIGEECSRLLSRLLLSGTVKWKVD